MKIYKYLTVRARIENHVFLTITAYTPHSPLVTKKSMKKCDKCADKVTIQHIIDSCTEYCNAKREILGQTSATRTRRRTMKKYVKNCLIL